MKGFRRYLLSDGHLFTVWVTVESPFPSVAERSARRECMLQLAVGFILNGWVPLLFAVVLMLILHFGVILREESYLEAKFGQQYLAFKHEVRRWI